MKEYTKNPVLEIDGYKFCHYRQYPQGTEWIYQTWTPRKSYRDGITHAIHFGLQGGLADLSEEYDKYFFKMPLAKAINEFKEAAKGIRVDTKHLEALHKLGYLPIRVKALKEGTFTPIGVPMFTIENTHKDFYWLPGFLESSLSARIWLPSTTATVADSIRRVLSKYAQLTGDEGSVFFSVCDFSLRGMTSPESGTRGSCGHLLSFAFTETVSASYYLKHRYNAEDGALGYVPATEHSIMCAYGEDELSSYDHLITNAQPDGLISIVSDSYNLWDVVDKVMPALKDKIMVRDGKVLMRPDSGCPVKILCGDSTSKDETIRKGLVERLGEIFGTSTNEKGYKDLSPKIGILHGDSITVAIAEEVCKGLMAKGFASTNIVFGVGTMLYQANTRDTFGFALKATAIKINGKFKPIFKDPKTDTDKIKKSQKGMVAVVMRDGDLRLIEDLTPEEHAKIKDCMLEEHFVDGKFVREEKFEDIRERVKSEAKRVYGI